MVQDAMRRSSHCGDYIVGWVCDLFRRGEVMDPLIHAEMALLVQREKKLEQEKAALLEEMSVWGRRVELAKTRGMAELAQEASEQVKQISERGRAVSLELEVIEMEKSILRKENQIGRAHV